MRFLEEDFKLVVNFCGVSAFALIVAVILHELGHMLAVFIFEGELAKLWFHPFQGARVTFSLSNQENAIFVTSGGILFGGLAGGLITLILWKFRRPFLAPFLMIGVSAFAGNGLMLVVGSLFSNVGDIQKLIDFGVSKVFLMFLGLVFLWVGFIIFFLLHPCLGIRYDDNFFKRYCILGCGLAPYIFCILIYSWLYNPASLAMYMIYIVASLILLFVAVLLSKVVHSYCFPKMTSLPSGINWKHAIFSVMLGVCSIVSCFLLFQ